MKMDLKVRSNKTTIILSLVLAIQIFNGTPLLSQRFFEPSDSLNSKRVKIVHVGAAGLYATTMVGLYQVWYKNQVAEGFQFFNDSKDWLQMDKMGHIYTANLFQERAFSAYNWSGVPKGKALLFSTGFSFLFMNTFEVLDGFSQDYGFSFADIASNSLGLGIFSAQQLLWDKQIVRLKFSYSHSPFAQHRPNTLGANNLERVLKDYNGQTYWLSINLGLATPDSWHIPDWLCISLGYSISEKLKSDEVQFVSPLTGESFHAYRRYLLSFDVDLTQLNIQKPWLKAILSNINVLKIPFPAVEWSSKTQWRAYGLYF
jgi:hypothetical protein